jgi:glycosyltransferase involved in cell wall biosynthesis
LESRSASYYYSLANKTFDYMHHGIPAIHMAFPEYLHINKEQKFFLTCKQLDVHELSTLILKVTSEPELYKQLSQNNLLAAQAYNWNKEKELLIDFVNSLN